MDKGGRSKDPTWVNFWCIKEGKKTMAKCKICSHIMGGKADRMKIHLSRCEKLVTSPNMMTGNLEKNMGSNDSSSSKRGTENSDSSLKACKQPKLLQNDLQQFVMQTSPTVKHDLDLQIAKFIL